uniref:Uncharacterized protein n=1 Tax=Tetradesmus obliquus TaxID=3088 RepID=A0A383VAP5_TETOB|eukprot:jgi/Sobl393_1/14877/SZX62271.1
MLAHSYGSAVFTAAAAATSLQLQLLLLLLLAAAGPALCSGTSSSSSDGNSVVGWQQLLLSCTSFSSWTSNSGSSSDSVVHWQQLLLSCTSFSTWLFIVLNASSLLAVQYMVRQVLRLFRVLSPGASDAVLRPQLNLALLWLGWVLGNALLAFCMAYCYFCDRIMWGGIRYHKAGGRVRRVVHPGQQ